MAPNRSNQFKHTPQARVSDGQKTPYYRRPVDRIPARSIDGIGERRMNYIPSNQYEYLDSLQGVPPKLSRSAGQHSGQGTDNLFGIKVDHALSSAAARFQKVRAFLPAAGLALVLFVSILGLSSARSGEHAEADKSLSRASIETLIDTGSEISERRPTDIQNYQVAGDLPRMLHIESMGLSARVRRVGVGTDTEIRLPSNIYDAGWYESSVKPGETGAVVLTGHASGPTKPGIFHDLTELKPGDELSLETGDGQTYTYYVAKLEVFRDEDPLEPILVPAVPGLPGLNLVTETGHYDAKANTYAERLVVYTVQKN